MPLVSSSQIKISHLLNHESHTASDEKEIDQLLKFNQRFEKRDAYLYAKQAPSDAELARNTSLNFLRETNMPPRLAIQTVRQFASRPDYMWDKESSEQEDSVNAVFDGAADDLGFTILGAGSMTPDNKEQAQWHARAALNKAIKIVKDPALAVPLARRFMLQKSTRIKDQFVFDGARVDDNSVLPAENYFNLVDRDERHKDKYEAAGFPRNRELGDSSNTIIPYPNSLGYTVRSDSPVDGSPIFIDIDAATKQADLPVITGQNFIMDIFEQEQLKELKQPE